MEKEIKKLGTLTKSNFS